MTIALIDEAVADGAKVEEATKLIGITPRTLTRWRAKGGGEDKRREAASPPAHKLTAEERRNILDTVRSPAFCDLSVRQIVPLLADQNKYIASESSFYRVCREAGELTHRGHARPRKSRQTKEHRACTPNQVWSWDITYLQAPVRGTYFYLYMIVDVYSRKIVGWRVEQEESTTHSSALISDATGAEQVDPKQLVLHADNGGPMKGSTMLATLQRLGVIPSFSRPAVSDDNPYAEALFRTLKYRPGYPRKPFATIEAARAWVASFVAWYNNEHLHSGIRYVTPSDRHAGRDKAVLAGRAKVYRRAQRQHPRRWSGKTRNWQPVGAVYLNPAKRTDHTTPLARTASS